MVCLAITNRTARMRTQLTSKLASSQRFFHLGITHRSMLYSISAASLPFPLLCRRYRYFGMKDRRGSETTPPAWFLIHAANGPNATKELL